MTHWTTRDGKKIPVPELGTEHLINILRMLKRGAMVRMSQKELSYLCIQVEVPDDIVNVILNELDALEWRQFVHPIFEQLEAEAKRRGIIWCDEKEDLLWQTKLTLMNLSRANTVSP